MLPPRYLVLVMLLDISFPVRQQVLVSLLTHLAAKQEFHLVIALPHQDVHAYRRAAVRAHAQIQ